MNCTYCEAYDITKINSLYVTLKNEINVFFTKKVFNLTNKYKNNLEYDSIINEKIDDLIIYSDILRRLKEQLLIGEKPCLTDHEFQLLYEKIINIIGKNCYQEDYDIFTNDSKKEIWLMKNPYCESYESWEKFSHYICKKINLELTVEKEKKKDIVFEISRKTIKPEVLLAISAYKTANKLNLKVDRTKEENKIDFKLLTEKVPEANIDFKLYSSLTQKNMSFDVIKTIYESDLEVVVEGNELLLNTPINTYKIDDFSDDIKPEYLEKFDIKTDIDKNNLMQDYK